jgi:uncharacterized membrane protein
MNEPVTLVPAPKSEQELARLRQLTLVVYILYAVSCLIGVTALVAIIINYIKREDVQGTIYQSHFTWQIRTFWWALGWFVLGALTAMVFVGFLIMAVAAVWTIYRLVKGWLYWNDHKPLPIAS